MIKSHVGHIVFNINPQNVAFYKDLLGFLGWSVWYEEPGALGMGEDGGSSLWFVPPIKEGVSNDYDGLAAVNHVGIAVGAQADVDKVVAYLREKGVPALFDTPRHRPEFSSGPDQTYYQVMFESPDRLLLEVVYTGPKSG